MRILCVSAALLLVTACDGTTPAVGNNAAEAAQQTMLQPGKYQIDFVREVMMPGSPSEPQREVEMECLTKTDVEHPETMLLPGTGECTDREVRIADGEISAKMRCRMAEADAADVGFEVRGTYDEDSAELTADATLPAGTLRETRTFKRLGEC
jgi:hypothetical protein